MFYTFFFGFKRVRHLPLQINMHFTYTTKNYIFSNLFNPLSNYLASIIFQNTTQFDEDLKKLIFIFMIMFYFVVLFTYSIFIIPIIFRENKDLNKTKIILGVIPKIVLYDIIKTEYLNESEM